MPDTETLSLTEIEDLSVRALMAAGTTEANARPLAAATAATEADGVASHGPRLYPDLRRARSVRQSRRAGGSGVDAAGTQRDRCRRSHRFRAFSD